MVTKQSKPSRLKVDIWVEGKGFDVDQLSLGETGLTYRIRIRTNKGRRKAVDLKSVALGSTPLVLFSHATPREWTTSVKTIRKRPGTDHIDVDVDKTATGSSTLQALELVLSDPYAPTGTTTETVTLDLPLTVA